MKKILLMLTILVQVSVVFSQTHFVKGYTSTNAYDPMAIVIKSADIGGVPLDVNDEIAVFDGNLCVGVVVLDGPINPNIQLNASTEYPVGAFNGFTAGKTMYFRFWDSSASTEYHNVIPTVMDKDDNSIPNVFASNGTAFVELVNGNTTKTWTDLSSTGWNDPDAWEPIGAPDPTNNITIPAGLGQYPIFLASDAGYCGSLTIEAGATLTVYSTSSGTGSLIAASGISGAGVVNTRRYFLANGWHLVSSPVSDQTIAAFLAANAGNIPTKNSKRAMMEYDEGADNWSDFFADGAPGNLTSGKGFGLQRSTNGFVTFTGSLSNGDITAPVTTGGFGWNLLGNPYPSAMYVQQEVLGFIAENWDMLDASFKGLYLWDPTANAGSGGYTPVLIDEGQSNLASGQGFFVKAASSGNVTFKQTMQVHQTNAAFKSALVPSPNVVLNAKSGNIYSSTKIKFNEEMTLGLDPSYDAGLLRSGNGFDIYSRLVTDNGVDFAVQALPGKSSDSYVIPIGVDAVKGGEIVLSAQSLNLPVGYDVIIEDRLTNSQTIIKNGELYVAEVGANSKGVGRFYLHVGSSLQTGLEEIHQDDISVYSIDQNVYIKGSVSKNAQFMVYSIDGRLMNRFGATSQNLNRLSIAGYSPGVYLINVKDQNNYKSVKFVVGK